MRGIREGSISPLIFNVYSEYIFQKALDKINEGILLNGERINNIGYTDDMIQTLPSIKQTNGY